MKQLAAIVTAILIAGLARADVIHLKDGTRVEGEIKKTDEGYRVRAADGSISVVPSEKIESIEVRPVATAEAAAQRLASLRRAVDNLSDLRTIIERYEKFIDQNPGSPALVEANQDLDLWRDRQARHLVKVGAKWVTADEQLELAQKSSGVANALRSMMKAGRLKEAGTVLARALPDDPTNLSLLYLKGVLQYRQEELPGSRKSFEAVLVPAPDHAPTLNNLAVILWRQNAMVAALGYYDRAMLAAPLSREILDNVAEALNALPEPLRKGPVVAKVVRHFKEQDSDLQKKLAERGLTRWGSTWVTEEQSAKLVQAEKDVNDKLTAMSRDFDGLQARINSIDRAISDDQQEMKQIDQSTYQTDSSGRVLRLPYPARFYDLRREIESLQNERVSRVSQQEALRRDAKTVQQKLPVQKYSGIQKIIDEDGMPVLAPSPDPRTRPSTQPAASLGQGWGGGR